MSLAYNGHASARAAAPRLVPVRPLLAGWPVAGWLGTPTMLPRQAATLLLLILALAPCGQPQPVPVPGPAPPAPGVPPEVSPAPAASVTVQTAAQLMAVLGALPADVSVVRLPNDITFDPRRDVTAKPIVLNRSITIRGTPTSPNATYARINWSFLPAVIQLQPGVVLSFERLELQNTFSRVSAHLDFMASSPDAVLRLRGCIVRRIACLPLPTAEQNYRSLPRPDSNSTAQVGRSTHACNAMHARMAVARGEYVPAPAFGPAACMRGQIACTL